MGKRDLVIGDRDLLVDLDKGEDLADLRYGRWTEREDGRYLIPVSLGGSDYSGTLVERSNARAWCERFDDSEDQWWTNAPGGHGTFAIVIDTKGIPEDVEDDVAEFLNGLQDYPLADEDLHSKMEIESQEEAWNDWGRKNFLKAIEKHFEVEFEDDPDQKLVDEIFYESCDKANENWINEQGDSSYIDMDRVVAKGVTREDLKQLMKSSLTGDER